MHIIIYHKTINDNKIIKLKHKLVQPHSATHIK